MTYLIGMSLTVIILCYIALFLVEYLGEKGEKK